MNRSKTFYWALYDFANSFVLIAFTLYFSQWLVNDMGVSDFWYNMLYTFGTLLLLLTAPIFGARADEYGVQKRYLVIVTALSVLFYLATAISATAFSSAVAAAIFFIFANYLYQFCFVFYNALIVDVATEEKQGLASGIGQMMNWVGQIAGILFSLLFTGGAVFLIGHAGKTQPLLPAVLMFALLGFISLALYKKKEWPSESEKAASKFGPKEFFAEFRLQYGLLKQLLKTPGVGMYLIAFFLFADALITASTNYPLFLSGVYHASTATSSFILLGILVTSAIGAIVSGWVSDKIGMRKALLITLGSFLFIFPLIAVIQNFTLHIVAVILMGFMYGSVWAVTRAAMAKLCPSERLNHGFSYYTLAERFSTLIGPLAWGITTWALAGYGALKYRIAICVMAFFVLGGFYLVSKIKEFE